MRRWTLPLVALLMLTTTSMSFVARTSNPAAADTPDIWRNNGNRMCLYHRVSSENTYSLYLTPSCSAQYEGHHFHVHALSGPQSWYRIVSNANDRCLHALGGSGGAGDILVEPCQDGRREQFWEITRWSNNRYTIKSVAFGNCFTSERDSDTIGSVWLEPCPGGNPYQEWVRD